MQFFFFRVAAYFIGRDQVKAYENAKKRGEVRGHCRDILNKEFIIWLGEQLILQGESGENSSINPQNARFASSTRLLQRTFWYVNCETADQILIELLTEHNYLELFQNVVVTVN